MASLQDRCRFAACSAWMMASMFSEMNDGSDSSHGSDMSEFLREAEVRIAQHFRSATVQICRKQGGFRVTIELPRGHGNAIAPMNLVGQWDARDSGCLSAMARGTDWRYRRVTDA